MSLGRDLIRSTRDLSKRSEPVVQGLIWKPPQTKIAEFCLGNLLQVMNDLMIEKLFPMSNQKLPSVNLCSLSLVLLIHTTVKSLLFSKLNKPYPLCVSAWSTCSSLLLGSLCWTLSTLSMSYFFWGVEVLNAVCLLSSNKCWVEGGNHFPQHAGYYSANTADTVSVFSFQGTLLAHVQLAVYQAGHFQQVCSPASQFPACTITRSYSFQNLAFDLVEFC